MAVKLTQLTTDELEQVTHCLSMLWSIREKYTYDNRIAIFTESIFKILMNREPFEGELRRKI